MAEHSLIYMRQKPFNADGRHNAILEQIFQKMTENGKKFMVDVYKFAIANIRKIHPRAGEKIIDIRREIAARK